MDLLKKKKEKSMKEVHIIRWTWVHEIINFKFDFDLHSIHLLN